MEGLQRENLNRIFSRKVAFLFIPNWQATSRCRSNYEAHLAVLGMVYAMLNGIDAERDFKGSG